MTNLGREVRRELARVPTLKVASGTYLRAEGPQVVVVIEGSEAVMPLHSAAWPMPRERVRCVNLDGHWICLGPESPRQEWGEVVALGTGGKVTVEYPPGSGVTAEMLLPRGDEALVGDFALLNWANGGVIVRLFGDEPTPPPPPAPEPAPSPTPSQPTTRTFRAHASGSADGNGRWIRDALYARTSPQGAAAWFHGTAIRDAVAGRTVTGGRIYMPMLSFANGQLVIGYHTLAGKSGVPNIEAPVFPTAPNGWWELPLSIAQALATDGRGVSLRTASGGAPAYKSIAQDPLSGQIELTYR